MLGFTVRIQELSQSVANCSMLIQQHEEQIAQLKRQRDQQTGAVLELQRLESEMTAAAALDDVDKKLDETPAANPANTNGTGEEVKDGEPSKIA